MGTPSKCDLAVEVPRVFKMVYVISDETLELIRELHQQKMHCLLALS